VPDFSGRNFRIELVDTHSGTRKPPSLVLWSRPTPIAAIQSGSAICRSRPAGWAERIRTSRIEPDMQISRIRLSDKISRLEDDSSNSHQLPQKGTHNVSGLHANSAGISVRWSKRLLKVRILSTQPASELSTRAAYSPGACATAQRAWPEVSTDQLNRSSPPRGIAYGSTCSLTGLMLVAKPDNRGRLG
jgi:hypothetical protein